LSTTVSVLGQRVQTRRFRWAGTLLGVVPLAAALAYVWLHFDTFGWKEFRHTFALIDQRWLLAGLALAALSYVGRTLRWQFTELFKLPVERATGLALLIWAGSSLVAVPLGVPCLFHEGLGWRASRELWEESGL